MTLGSGDGAIFGRESDTLISSALRGWKIPAAVVILAMVIPGLALGRRDVLLTRADTGRSISVRQGALVTVMLEGNPSTGFEWHTVTVDSSILAPPDSPAFEADDTLMGSAGVFRFDFRAIRAGSTDLRLEYFRSWERDIPPQDSFTVRVEVKGRG